MSEENKGVLNGFKQFLMRGNVVDLAVAVVVGAAFTNIVNAVVKGMINPVVGALGSKNLDQYALCLSDKCVKSQTGEVTEGLYFLWGSVLSATLTFVITAAVVYFLMVMPMNRYKDRQAAKEAPAEETPAAPTEVELLTEIRDALVAQRNGHLPAQNLQKQ
ncbi:large conductance mechanosensitive channel protein MscL [Streptomyces pathocidini]|uniref:Large-conductance mechanosensitive channel n=1 Tax=Streptomyces pathocidini TaxID=1650571 RepID=A0ABW7UWG2_9ACTN|nr:large conductance mechanosensitive channel protein MscL [Streptomyces pathocidini]